MLIISKIKIINKNKNNKIILCLKNIINKIINIAMIKNNANNINNKNNKILFII